MAFLVLSLLAYSQAKKPILMVVPAGSWCHERGYITPAGQPDFARALVADTDLLPVVAKIGELMSDAQFPLKDMAWQLRSGDSLLQRSSADIFLEVAWKVNKVGPKRSITYTLRGLDAYTYKQIATASGTGLPSFSAELPVLLHEAVIEQMDGFQAQLQQYFDDLFAHGREVSISLSIASGSRLTMEDEVNGEPLTDIVDEWMAQHTVDARYNLTESTNKRMFFEQVRIPLYADNGIALDARRFATELRRFLTDTLHLKAKVSATGLGRADVVITR